VKVEVKNDEHSEEAMATDEEATAEDGKPAEEEAVSANTSLVADDDMTKLAAPVVTQPKVAIQITINKRQPVSRLDSAASSATTPGDEEDTEFDKDAIVTEKVSQEMLDTQKPRMKGKRFQEWPMKKADSDLSGLCSIM